MIKLIVIIVVVFVVITISIIAGVITTNYDSNQGATSSPIQKPIGTMSYNDIVRML